MPHRPASTALDHLTVLDLTHVRAGPVCVRQLADWGAKIIRIERPGDPADFAARQEADFQNKHRGKRGMALDLRSDEGRAILYRLVQQADVVVENFRPEIKQRLKFDYETLKKHNPRIILASISAFGQDGPYVERPGVDQIIQGVSGLMSVNGDPEGPPMRVGIPISDIVTGLYAALGIFVALVERDKSGQGQWVQASLLESQMFMLDVHAARYLVNGIVGKRVGNEHPTGVPTNCYRTKDGYVNIAVTPAMWPRLCKAIGRDDLAEDPDYCTREVRRKRRKEVNAVIQSVTETMDTETLLQRLRAGDVPCGPIYTIDQAYADPQAQHLQLAQEVVNTSGKPIKLPRQPMHLSRTPSKLTMRTPEFGEHTDEILLEFGFTPAEIKTFRDNKSIE